jgi:hypothetical protein
MLATMLAKTIDAAAFKPTAIRRALLAGVLVATATLSQSSLGQANPNPNPTNPDQTNPDQTSAAQKKPEIRPSAAALELPVVLQEKVIAGKTPVGTKVRAKLAVATLLAGVVIPQDAVISGEVIESAAKSAADPSRLSIRMDSAQFKNGATPTVVPLQPKLYLTAWYYPAALTLNQNSSSGIPDAAHNPAPLGGGSIYPGQRNPNSPPISGPDAGADTFPPPASGGANHRVLMKHVDSSIDSGGVVTLTSKHSNIKLDRSTTYVLAATDLLPIK